VVVPRFDHIPGEHLLSAQDRKERYLTKNIQKEKIHITGEQKEKIHITEEKKEKHACHTHTHIYTYIYMYIYIYLIHLKIYNHTQQFKKYLIVQNYQEKPADCD
jgi:hypothetical protein